MKLLKIFSIIFVSLFALIVIFRLVAKNVAQPEAGQDRASAAETAPVTASQELKTAEALVKKLYPEAYQQLESNLEKATQEEVDKLTREFDTIIDEADREIARAVLPLADRVKVDKNKSDVVYAKELQRALSDLTKIQVDVLNPQRLPETSSFYRQKTLILSGIQPSKNFHNFHLFWVISFGTKAYIFDKLSRQVAPERRFALLNLLDQVLTAEDKAIKLLQSR